MRGGRGRDGWKPANVRSSSAIHIDVEIGCCLWHQRNEVKEESCMEEEERKEGMQEGKGGSTSKGTHQLDAVDPDWPWLHLDLEEKIRTGREERRKQRLTSTPFLANSYARTPWILTAEYMGGRWSERGEMGVSGGKGTCRMSPTYESRTLISFSSVKSSQG